MAIDLETTLQSNHENPNIFPLTNPRNYEVYSLWTSVSPPHWIDYFQISTLGRVTATFATNRFIQIPTLFLIARKKNMEFTKVQEIELPAAFDAHVHLRDGEMSQLVTHTIRQGGVNQVYVMVSFEFDHYRSLVFGFGLEFCLLLIIFFLSLNLMFLLFLSLGQSHIFFSPKYLSLL